MPKQAVPPSAAHTAAHGAQAACGPQIIWQSASRVQGKHVPLSAQYGALPVVVVHSPGSPALVVQATSAAPQSTSCWPGWHVAASCPAHLLLSRLPCLGLLPSQTPEQQCASLPLHFWPTFRQPKAFN